MVVVTAPRGAKLLSQTLVSLRRLYSSASPTAADDESNARSKPGHSRKPAKAKKGLRMSIPTSMKRFVAPDGKLHSTPGIHEFLKKEGIAIDNSKGEQVYFGPGQEKVGSDFSVRVTYSPFHIMQPHHLAYLNPRGHPVIEAIKAKYRLKKKQEPLWMFMNSRNGYSGLIKSMGHRRLTGAFWRAMTELGYGRWRSTEGTDVRGTVIVTIFDTLKASNQPAEVFGKAAAEAVVKMCKAQARAQSQRRDENSRRLTIRKVRPLEWKPIVEKLVEEQPSREKTPSRQRALVEDGTRDSPQLKAAATKGKRPIETGSTRVRIGSVKIF